MAKGISNRTRLSMRDHTRDMDGAITDLKRWGDQLPFGAFGWHLQSTINGVAFATATSQVHVYNKIVQNREGFFNNITTPIVITTATVPRGGSGLYLMWTNAFWGAAVAHTTTIARNGNAIAQEKVTQDRITVFAMELLNDGDQMTVVTLNQSGGNITSNAFAGDATSPPLPTFKGYRVSLL